MMRADLDAAHHLLVAAELARMEDLDLDLPFELRVGPFGVLVGGDREQRPRKADVAEAERYLSGGRDARRQQADTCNQKNRESLPSHSSPFRRLAALVF